MQTEYERLRTEYNKESFRKYLSENLRKECSNCGNTENIEFHHVVPLRVHGTNRISNIIPLCHRCHKLAHGSVDIHKIACQGNEGRPRKQPVFGYKDIVKRYVFGEIGRKQCSSELKLGKAVKMTDLWYFREFLEENNISVWRNKIDLLETKKRNIPVDRECCYVEYKDGSTFKRYESGKIVLGNI